MIFHMQCTGGYFSTAEKQVYTVVKCTISVLLLEIFMLSMSKKTACTFITFVNLLFVDNWKMCQNLTVAAERFLLVTKLTC